MKSSIRATARQRAARAMTELQRLRHAPLTWPVISGLILMVAIAIGTGLAIERFRQDGLAD